MRVAWQFGRTSRFARRAQIGSRGAPPPALAGGTLEVAGVLLPGTVEIVVGRQAGLDGGFDQAIGQFVAARLVGDAQRPIDPVEFVRPALLILGLAEVRQDAVVVPAYTAALAPFIVVGRVAAHVDHAVDRTGAAKHFAARLIQRAVVEARLRFALEHPVDTRIGVHLVETHGDVDPRIGVATAGFQQQHAIAAGFAEPGSDRATGRAGAGDDVVETFVVGGRRFPPASPVRTCRGAVAVWCAVSRIRGMTSRRWSRPQGNPVIQKLHRGPEQAGPILWRSCSIMAPRGCASSRRHPHATTREPVSPPARKPRSRCGEGRCSVVSHILAQELRA
jgi:hypothetical protein